ncbi:putative metalloprotease family M14A [Phytophthora cinnamomi]|uniref:putative metalloprotease family M14A n=1 Tax=Phytophthora cinnamomi TaxID=4785 RepID=UPI003559418D|nr:putative metalloprotease family M14A [Phytophthora cinnamomi]
MASAADDADASVLRRVATTGPGKTVSRFPERGLLFSSRFDGGNMANVEQLASGAFSVKVSEDAAAFGISTGYSTWFYLEVERGPVGGKREGKTTKNPQELQLVLANLNPQRGLFQNGYTVMYSSVEVVDSTEETTAATPCVFQDERRWARLPTPLSFEKYSVPVGQKTPEQGENSAVGQQQGNEEDGGESGHETTGPQKSLVAAASETTVASEGKQEFKIRVSFTYRFKFARERVRFAFCYPYTYTRVQEELAAMDKLFARTELQPECSPTNEKAPANVYYHRELLTRSLEGLRVDLVTISSMDGITSTRGPPKRSLDASQLESAFKFDPKQKKMVVISARVHSGETPANFMLDGMLQLLLHPTDESAIALRRHFVFKIIPMLNPDGVCQGFYRTDTRGVNLNRVYEDPQPEFAPAVFALKNFLLDSVIDYGGADSQSAQDNIVYLDLHAHANRRGCFIFGNNHLPDTLIDSNNDAIETAIVRQVKTQLYARLVGLHTPFFDYMACLFDKDNMTRRDLRDNNNATTSRQGSSRVALYRVTGLTYVYTIECNFNEGRRNLRASSLVPSSSAPAAAATSSAGPTRRCPSSKGSAKRVQADNLRMSRQTAPTSGTRLYLKYSPAEWKDVGIGALVALLDLFELPGAGQRLEESPFRSRDGIRKNLLAEIKSVASNEGGTSAKTSRLSKPKTRHGAKPQIQVKA